MEKVFVGVKLTEKDFKIIPCTNEEVAQGIVRGYQDKHYLAGIMSHDDLIEMIKIKNKIGSKKVATTTTKEV